MKDFKRKLLGCPGTTYTKPSGSNDRIYRVIHKFTVGKTKYRIRADFKDGYLFEYIPEGSRLYRLAATFQFLDKAEEYIFTTEAPE